MKTRDDHHSIHGMNVVNGQSANRFVTNVFVFPNDLLTNPIGGMLCSIVNIRAELILQGPSLLPQNRSASASQASDEDSEMQELSSSDSESEVDSSEAEMEESDLSMESNSEDSLEDDIPAPPMMPDAAANALGAALPPAAKKFGRPKQVIDR